MHRLSVNDLNLNHASHTASLRQQHFGGAIKGSFINAGLTSREIRRRASRSRCKNTKRSVWL